MEMSKLSPCEVGVCSADIIDNDRLSRLFHVIALAENQRQNLVYKLWSDRPGCRA
jgi:hypothetical protein